MKTEVLEDGTVVTTIEKSDWKPLGNILKLEIEGEQVAEYGCAPRNAWDEIERKAMLKFGIDPGTYVQTYCCDDGRNCASSWTTNGKKVRLGFKYFNGEWL